MQYRQIICVGSGGEEAPRLHSGPLLSCLVYGSLTVRTLINEFSKDVTKLPLLLPCVCFPFHDTLSKMWNLVQKIVSDKTLQS